VSDPQGVIATGLETLEVTGVDQARARVAQVRVSKRSSASSSACRC